VSGISFCRHFIHWSFRIEPSCLVAIIALGESNRRALAARLKSEECFRAIVETTPECVKLVAPDGTLLHMNLSGLEMVGADSAETVISAVSRGNDRKRTASEEMRDSASLSHRRS